MSSLLEANAAADRVTALILVNPALPFTPATPDPLVATVFAAGSTPGLGPALLRGARRRPPEQVVARVLSVCCADPSRVASAVVARHVELEHQRADFAEADRDLAAAARSVIRTAGPGRRAYREAFASLRRPVLLIHGERDRLVPASAAAAVAIAHRSWSLRMLRGVGHLPQLEAPTECSAAIFTWLDTAARAAARAATPAPAVARPAAGPPLASAAPQVMMERTPVQRLQSDRGNAGLGLGRQSPRSADRRLWQAGWLTAAIAARRPQGTPRASRSRARPASGR